MMTFNPGDKVRILRENTDNPYMVGIIGIYSGNSNHEVNIDVKDTPSRWKSNNYLIRNKSEQFPNGYYYCLAYDKNNMKLPALELVTDQIIDVYEEY